MIKLNKVELWCEQPDAPPAGNVPVTQADLDELRRVLNGFVDVINTLVLIAHR